MSPKMNTSNLSIVSWSVGMAASFRSVMFVRCRNTLGRVCTSAQNSRSGSLARKRSTNAPYSARNVPSMYKHVDARLDDRRHGRPLVVLHDLLFGRPAARGPCRCGGP